MNRYHAYKDSGEQWLGDIPSHWETIPMRYILHPRKSIVGGDSYKYDLLSLTLMGIVKRDIDNPTGKFPSSFDTYQIVQKGDFVFCLFDNEETPRAVGLSDLDGMITGAYDVMQLKSDKILPYYLNYYLIDIDNGKRLKPLYKGLRKTVPLDSFLSLKYPIPPLSEQTAIVSYLDRVTAQIDKAIAQQQRMIDLLNERKQIIIQHAVTKGLDPNAEMVDSGVKWIGEMPKGWKSTPLRFVFEMRNGYTPSKNDPSFWNGGTIPWFRMEDIRKRGRFLKEATQYVTTKAVNGKGTFSAGSYIMAICTASIGEHAILIADSLANQRFANFKICKSLSSLYSPMFLYYYFFVIGDFCRHNENSTCFQYVDMDALKNFPILQPSMKIQNEIVSFLDKNLERLEVTLKQTEKRISLLRERKQIIINEVVTGKVKVS